MAIARVKQWVAGEVLTAPDLNNEFNNITASVLLEPFVATQPLDLNGQLLLLDADGDTLLDASTNDVVDLTIGGADDFRFSANLFSALAGSSIRLDQGDLVMSAGDVVLSSGRILEIKAGDITASATVTVPTTGNVVDIIGTTTISAFSTTQQGTQFLVRFTGVGLNLTHNATSFISPWGRTYRTVPNEVLCFLSLGGGNYQFWSLNGPKERVGVTIEHNATTAVGYLPEDGTAVSRTTYVGLYEEIGTTYGVGDGSTTFNMPDSRGRTVINVDGAADRITADSTGGTNADTLGGVGGTESHELIIAEMPAHTHTVTPGGTAGAAFGGTSIAGVTGSTSSTTGGGATHSNTQPWIAKTKLIRF